MNVTDTISIRSLTQKEDATRAGLEDENDDSDPLTFEVVDIQSLEGVQSRSDADPSDTDRCPSGCGDGSDGDSVNWSTFEAGPSGRG